MLTVLRDSGELIKCLEKVELTANCLLVTADVSSLYPNIDIKKAIVALVILLARRLSVQRRVVFKTSFNCSHVGIKKVILKHLPDLSTIVSYKSINTLPHPYK